jgi:hypothetical protein
VRNNPPLERFFQRLPGEFLQFAPIISHSPQNRCGFRLIYYLHLDLAALSTEQCSMVSEIGAHLISQKIFQMDVEIVLESHTHLEAKFFIGHHSLNERAKKGPLQGACLQGSQSSLISSSSACPLALDDVATSRMCKCARANPSKSSTNWVASSGVRETPTLKDGASRSSSVGTWRRSCNTI